MHKLRWHVTTEGNNIVVYEGDVKLTVRAAMRRDDVARAFGVNRGDIFTLMVLFVPDVQRANGVGSSLLKETMRNAWQSGCSIVEVDDMSDRFNRPHNIYRNHGFKYRKHGFPEMLITRQMASKAKVFAN